MCRSGVATDGSLVRESTSADLVPVASAVMCDLSANGEAAAVAPPQGAPAPPVRPGKAPPKVYAPVTIPTPEALAQEEVVNSCVTRSVMAGVMGALTHQNCWITLRASSHTATCRRTAGQRVWRVHGRHRHPGAGLSSCQRSDTLSAPRLAWNSLDCLTQAAAAAGTAAVAGTPATLTWRDTARASARSAARKSWCVALCCVLVKTNTTSPTSWSTNQVLRQGVQHNGRAVLRLRVCDREGKHKQLPCPWPPCLTCALFAQQARAKHDTGNSAAAGCFTGGVLARTGANPLPAMRCQQLLTRPAHVLSRSAGHGGGLRDIRSLFRPHGHDTGHALIGDGHTLDVPHGRSASGAAPHPQHARDVAGGGLT